MKRYSVRLDHRNQGDGAVPHEKGQMRRGETVTCLRSRMEEHGLEPVSNEALLKSCKIHSGLHVWRMDSGKLIPEARDNLSFKLAVPHDRVGINHL